LSVWSTLRAHDAHAPCRRSAREGERPTAARSTCASRVLTELRARAARKASARRRVRRYPAAHGVTGSAAIDAAALFARRCPSRRAMACGKSSGRPDAPLSHLATGRPPRCALLPIGDSRALVPHPVSPLPPQPSLYRRRAGGWPARRLRFAIARMRRRACRSRGRSPAVCATAVLLATLGRRCAVARLALQPMRASRHARV